MKKLVNMYYSLNWSNSVVTSPSCCVGELTIISVHLSTTNRRSDRRVFARWDIAKIKLIFAIHYLNEFISFVPGVFVDGNSTVKVCNLW